MIVTKRVLLAGAFLGLIAAPASADSPTLLGTFKDWSAFQTVTGNSKVCYAMARPSASQPKKSKRDPISFLISDWPGRRAKAELEIIPGYQYKDGSDVTAQVGTEKTTFFIRNEGGAGSAWVDDAGAEQHLVSAMAHGAKVVITGVSQRGTTTKDTYALDGLSSALDKIHAACGM